MNRPLPPSECVQQLKQLREEVALAINSGDETNFELFKVRYQQITGRISQ